MLKKVICYLFAIMFLAGGIIFPLGDFSLMRDIPHMYQNYTKITSEDEMGVVDFIGDYLLHGKQILGHNAHDKTPAKGDEVQFLHQANSLNIAFGLFTTTFFNVPFSVLTHPIFNPDFQTSDFRTKLFKPPLNC